MKLPKTTRDPEPLPKESLFAPGEEAVLKKLTEAWNIFVALPGEHAEELNEFRHGIHTLQNMVLSRPARRQCIREVA
jgi:hypothetical protein